MASAEDHVRYAFVGQVINEAIKVYTEDVAFGFLFLVREAQALRNLIIQVQLQGYYRLSP